MIDKVLTRFLGSKHNRDLKKLLPLVKQINELEVFEPSSVILDRIKVENEVLRLQVVSDSAEIVHFTTLLDSAEKAKNTFKGKHDEKINVINRLDGDGLYNALAGLKR